MSLTANAADAARQAMASAGFFLSALISEITTWVSPWKSSGKSGRNARSTNRLVSFVIAGACFALEEATGKTAGGAEFLAVLHLQRQEVDALAGFLGRHHGCEQDGIAEAHRNGAIGLFGQHPGLDGDDLPSPMSMVLVIACGFIFLGAPFAPICWGGKFAALPG
jgi:hypothetical protein